MATIAEQLTQLNAVKQNFKTKFTAKGVDLTGVPFTEYPSKLDMLGDYEEYTSHTGELFKVQTTIPQNSSGAKDATYSGITTDYKAKSITFVYDTNSTAAITYHMEYMNDAGSWVSCFTGTVTSSNRNFTKTYTFSEPTYIKGFRIRDTGANYSAYRQMTAYLSEWYKLSNDSGTTKTQTLSQTSNTLYGGETQTLTFTFSNLSKVYGITEISGGVEFAWLQSIAINGNVVTAVVGNKRVSGGSGGKTTLKLTAIGTGSDAAQPTWVTKTGTHHTDSLSFSTGTSQTVTGTAFTAVKPTKLHLQYELVCREWVVGHTVKVEGLTESGSWVTLVTHTKTLDGDSSNASDYTMSHNGTVSVSTSSAIKQLRVYIDGRYWDNTITVKITEWQVLE